MLPFIGLVLWLNFSISKVSSSNECVCGMENVVSRVYLGKQIKVNKYPWLVHLRLLDAEYKDLRAVNICGASLISNDLVITAAHCLLDRKRNMTLRKEEDVQVYVGVNSRAIRVKKFHINKKYLKSKVNNDVAIIELFEKIQFNQTVLPICLSAAAVDGDDEEQIKDAVLKVVGRGATGPTSRDASKVPLETDLQIMERRECDALKGKYYAEHGKIMKSNVGQSELCAVNRNDNSNACNGDSGSPLMYKNPRNGLWFIVGLVSRSWTKCGSQKVVPVIFTKISPFIGKLMQMNVCLKQM